MIRVRVPDNPSSRIREFSHSTTKSTMLTLAAHDLAYVKRPPDGACFFWSAGTGVGGGGSLKNGGIFSQNCILTYPDVS